MVKTARRIMALLRITSAFICLLFTSSLAQNWAPPFGPPGANHQQGGEHFQPSGFVPGSFAPISSNNLNFQQPPPSDMNRPIYPGMFQSLPRMHLSLVQLTCETVPSQIPPRIRWVKQGSSAITSVPIAIAEGQNTLDPFQYAVTVEALPNGATRSVLTLLRPDPDSAQAAFSCQTVASSNMNQQAVGSREIYVIGNRQFVNANLAYHAADTTPYGPRTASAVAPEYESSSTTVQP